MQTPGQSPSPAPNSKQARESADWTRWLVERTAREIEMQLGHADRK